jgi:hypothetical protein
MAEFVDSGQERARAIDIAVRQIGHERLRIDLRVRSAACGRELEEARADLPFVMEDVVESGIVARDELGAAVPVMNEDAEYPRSSPSAISGPAVASRAARAAALSGPAS